MPIPKSAESRQHSRGLLTQHPSAVLETLAKDAPYLSNGRAKLHTARLDYQNIGRYHSYETRIEFVVDGMPFSRFCISNKPCPSNWRTEKGLELLSFVKLAYEYLENLAKEEEQKEASLIHVEMLAIGRRNDARLVEEWRRYW